MTTTTLNMMATSRPANNKEALLKEHARLMQALEDGARYRDIYPMMQRVEKALHQLKENA